MSEWNEARGRALGDELVRIHDGLRRELATLLADVDDFLDGRSVDRPVPGLDAQLRERCLAYCDSVHAHHSNETDRGFPLLERRYPGLAPALDRIRREHGELARIQQDVRRTLAEATTGDAARIRADLRNLAAELEAHFDREEEQLVTALNAL